MDGIFETVKDSINEIISMKGVDETKIDRDSKIVQDLGLKSLDIAQLIAMLESEFDKDPFSDGSATLADVLTVGDLCKIYE